jgi:uncharacterized protein (TIGR03067 family)
MNLLTALALASVAAAPVPKSDPVKDAQAAFQGEWRFVEYVREGRPQQGLADANVVVKGDKMEIQVGPATEEATLAFDPKAAPAAIDIQTRNGLNAYLVQGIYKFERDKLMICFGRGSDVRPKEFKSAEDLRTSMFVLERVKK